MKNNFALKFMLVVVMLFTTTISVQSAKAESTCQKDYFESNNDMNSPAQLSPGQYWATMCKGDIDVYKINISAGENVVSISGGAMLETDASGNIKIKTTGNGRNTNLPTDIDVKVYSYENGNLNWIGSSETDGTKKEEFRWTAKKSGTIYVYVMPWGDISSYNPYLITVGRFPKVYMPVNGIGEGVTTSIGSTAHKGVDTFAIDYSYPEKGIPVYSVLPGKIVFSGKVNDYGNVVVVRHWDDTKWDKKFYTIYAHLDANNLQPLGLVDMSKPVGYMEKSGIGGNGIIHLHFAMRSSNNEYSGLDALYGNSATPAFDARPFFK